MSDYRDTAEAAIEAIERAAERLALACREEMALEDERPILKAEAVKRIMQRDGLAATPAEKIVETDAEYAAHRRRQYDAVVEVQRARGVYEAAKRRADVAIDLGMLLGGSSNATEDSEKLGRITTAIATIDRLNCLGDAVYSVRERFGCEPVDGQPYRGSTWEHPKVKEYSDAVGVLQGEGLVR